MSKDRQQRFHDCGYVQIELSFMQRTHSGRNGPDFRKVIQQNLDVSPVDAVFRDEKDFLPGSLMFCKEFWEHEILKDHPQKDQLLEWIVHGVDIESLFKSYTKETFKNKMVEGNRPPKYILENYVPEEFYKFVSDTVKEYLSILMVRKWKDVKGPEDDDIPHLVLPLGVEPNKPRLIYDARFLNLFLIYLAFTMENVGKVPQMAWKGMYLFSIDHKSGYLHVPIHRSSWKYLGFYWDGEYYVYTCLPFGTSFSPYVYHSSNEAVARYIRNLGIPMKVYIDDSLSGTQVSFKDSDDEMQFSSACRAAYVVSMVYFLCGYFIGLKKCELYPRLLVKYLGMICDTANLKFRVPTDKAEKLIKLISSVLEAGVVNYRSLEKIVGKCTAMQVAVPMARLYTRVQYAVLKNNERLHKRAECDDIEIDENVAKELWQRIPLINGLSNAPWYKAAHFILRILADSNSICSRILCTWNFGLNSY